MSALQWASGQHATARAPNVGRGSPPSGGDLVGDRRRRAPGRRRAAARRARTPTGRTRRPRASSALGGPAARAPSAERRVASPGARAEHARSAARRARPTTAVAVGGSGSRRSRQRQASRRAVGLADQLGQAVDAVDLRRARARPSGTPARGTTSCRQRRVAGAHRRRRRRTTRGSPAAPSSRPSTTDRAGPPAAAVRRSSVTSRRRSTASTVTAGRTSSGSAFELATTRAGGDPAGPAGERWTHWQRVQRRRGPLSSSTTAQLGVVAPRRGREARAGPSRTARHRAEQPAAARARASPR